jgi:hypothetical protein
MRRTHRKIKAREEAEEMVMDMAAECSLTKFNQLQNTY